MDPGLLLIKIRDIRHYVSYLSIRKARQRLHVNVKFDMRDIRGESLRLAIQAFIHHAQCIVVYEPFLDRKRSKVIILSVYGSVVLLKVLVAVDDPVIGAVPVRIPQHLIDDDR